MDETKNVYIGNIPFDHTEEQVLEIAKSVGPVIDLKLLFDPMTESLEDMPLLSTAITKQQHPL